MNILLLGAPGAGKGTQAAKLVEQFGFTHLSTGDLFRAAIKNETETGLWAKSFIDEGKLVPDEVTIKLVEEFLAANEDQKILFDGFPRNVNQAEALEKILAETSKKLDYVINLDVNHDIIINRIIGRRICKDCGASYHVENFPSKVEGVCDKCGGETYTRADDTVESVETRLTEYSNQTFPLIEYYGEKGNLFTFDAVGNPSDIFANICELIK